MIIVGSYALALNNNETRGFDSDIDLIGIYPDKIPNSEFDYINVSEEVLKELNKHLTFRGTLTNDALLTLKMSHFMFDIKWEKTKRHIIEMLLAGYKVIPELYHVLKGYWETVHGTKDFLSLNKTKDEFFDDFVDYIYDHDELHEMVAYPNEPVYKGVLKENEEVLIDRDKFDNLPFESKIKMFFEEITVIAIERYLTNQRVTGKITYLEAFNYALKKTIQSLTKNWATDFIIFNLIEFQPDFNLFERVLRELKTKYDYKVIIPNYKTEFLEENCLSEKEAESLLISLKRNKIDEYSGPFVRSFDFNASSDLVNTVFEFNGSTYIVQSDKLGELYYKGPILINTIRKVKPTKKTITVYS